ncbi:MAG: dihydroneopterin aldolase, partial [Flavobacteriales bacterium]
MGLIILEGMVFFAHHGYYHEEQERGSKFIVDISITSDLSDAVASDDLNKALNYEEIYQLVENEMAEKSKLLEHIGGRIIKSLKERFAQIESVQVKVSKINPP